MIERIYTLSYYHHQIGSMNYYPLFRVRSWNNGVRCMSIYILILLNQWWLIVNNPLKRYPKRYHVLGINHKNYVQKHNSLIPMRCEVLWCLYMRHLTCLPLMQVINVLVPVRHKAIKPVMICCRWHLPEETLMKIELKYNHLLSGFFLICRFQNIGHFCSGLDVLTYAALQPQVVRYCSDHVWLVSPAFPYRPVHTVFAD